MHCVSLRLYWVHFLPCKTFANLILRSIGVSALLMSLSLACSFLFPCLCKHIEACLGILQPLVDQCETIGRTVYLVTWVPDVRSHSCADSAGNLQALFGIVTAAFCFWWRHSKGCTVQTFPLTDLCEQLTSFLCEKFLHTSDLNLTTITAWLAVKARWQNRNQPNGYDHYGRYCLSWWSYFTKKYRILLKPLLRFTSLIILKDPGARHIGWPKCYDRIV